MGKSEWASGVDRIGHLEVHSWADHHKIRDRVVGDSVQSLAVWCQN